MKAHSILLALLCGLASPLYCSMEAGAVSGVAPAAPSAPWVVRQVDLPVTSGGSLCSMKSSWPGGEELVFARDGKEANSIAVDFHQDLLTPGREYPVALQLEGMTRAVTGVAATAQILMIRMGYDHVFYDGLRQKNDLRISFGVRQASFGLQGSAEALKKLESCVSGLTAKPDAANPDRKLKSVFDILKEGTVQTPAAKPPAAAAIPVQPAKSVIKSSPPEERKTGGEGDSLVRQAVSSSLGEEIARLRAENRALLQENMAIRAAAEAPQIVDEGAAADVEPASGGQEEAENGLLSRVLLAADIPSLETFRAEDNRGASMKTFSWRDGQVTGTASDVPWPAGRTREEAVDAYLQAWKAVCSGDYAQTVGAPRVSGAIEIMEAEAVCVDDVKDSASAFLFIADGSGFVALAQEGDAETLPEVLGKRDAYIDAISTL